ncbi:hypothetical protein EKK58_03025 [Candidatus Dependentiae bacterium]|nr:MAG: hypothetical protein EKK58_03025 [Candidatus Dependentiae bacterium]
MLQKQFVSLFLIMFMYKPILIEARIFNFFERTIFGKNIANNEGYQELCNEIKEYFDISQDHKLYYARWPWTYFSSFTLHTGTWINKSVWDELDINEQIYTMYHEIAHKALAHPLKQYTRILSTLLLFGFIFYTMNAWNKKPLDNLIRKIIVNKWGPQAIKTPVILQIINCIFVPITILAITFIAASSFAKYCEQEADEKAAIALCEQDRNDIVENQINYLETIEQEQGNISSIFFPSIHSQIQYLKKIVKRYS